MKRCTYCKKNKSLSQFNVRAYKSGKFGHRSYCKKCGNVAAIRWRKDHPDIVSGWDRNKRLKNTYGITQKEYDAMLRSQHGRCAICRSRSTHFKYGLAVDHNHKTGKVRGLLCIKCNTAIGNLKTAWLLARAISYFEKHGE